MALLGYNRKLLWVVIPAIVWAWLGLALALAPPPGQRSHRDGGPVKFGIGPAGDSLFIGGVLKRVEERQDATVLTIELAPDAKRQILGRDNEPVSKLPPGLKVEYVAPGELPAGPPQLQLRNGQRSAKRLPSGAFGLLTREFLLKYEARGVRVFPRPLDIPPPQRDGRQRRDALRERVRERYQDLRERRRAPRPEPPGVQPAPPAEEPLPPRGDPPPPGRRGGDRPPAGPDRSGSGG